MAPGGGAAAAGAWGGVAGAAQAAQPVQQPAEVYRALTRAELQDAVAGVYEVPASERARQGLAQLAEWRRGMAPPNSRPLPLPVQAESPPHRRDPGPPRLVKGLAMRGQWQQALREFLANDEQLSSQVLLSAHKFVKGGGVNLNFALSTLTDMSWSVMVLVWEAWQDGRLSAVFDIERVEETFKTRYHELAQQFMDCRGAWLEELSEFRDQRRQRVWDSAKQDAYEAAFAHDVFEFIPEAALAAEHRPYFKQALQECVKMALTAGSDEKTRLLLEKIAKLEDDLAKALAEIERMKEEEREKEEKGKEYYKKPLRPAAPAAAPPEEPVKPPCREKEAQTDFNEPPPVVVTKEPDSQDAWRLQAEREKSARLEEEVRRLEALLRERDEELAALRQAKRELEEALGNQAGTAAKAARAAQLERDKAELLEKLKQLRQQLEEAEARIQSLEGQLAEANGRAPTVVKERRAPTKPAAVQTRDAPVEPAPPPPAPKRPKTAEAAAQASPPRAEAAAQTEPPPRRRSEERGVQAELEPEPPPGDEGELLRRIAELQRQLRAERERAEALERGARELEGQLEAERGRCQRLEEEMQRQLELGAAGSEKALQELRRRLERVTGERDEARRLLELEREKTRRLEEALQNLRNQLDDLRRKLEELGADVSEVDAVLKDEILQQVTRPTSRVFDRLWTDAQEKHRKKKEKEAEAFIYDSALSEALLKLRNPNSTNVSAGSWLFTDPACDATCPCCGRPCVSSTLAPGTWQASKDTEGFTAGLTAGFTAGLTAGPGAESRHAEVRPSGARPASPLSRSAKASSGATSIGGDGLGGVRAGQLHVDDLLSRTQLGRGASGGRGGAPIEGLTEEVVVKSLSAAFDEAGPGQAHVEEAARGRRSAGDAGRRPGHAAEEAAAAPGRRPARDAAPGQGQGLALDARRFAQAAEDALQAEEAGGRVRAAAPGPPSAVEARAAALSGGGVSFSEHCRRLGDGAAQTPEEPPDAAAKVQSKSLQLSHLLLGPERRLELEGGADAESQLPLPPKTPDGGSGGMPAVPSTLMRSMVPSIRPSTSSSPASVPPSIRPSTSSAHARRSAPLLPLGNEAAAAAQRARLALKQELSPASGAAAPEALAPPRPLSRRWLERSVAPPEGAACASPEGAPRAPGDALHRAASASHLGAGTSPTAQGESRRASPHRALPPSASAPRLDRCCARACGGLPAAAVRR